jgi:hypothetical protein
MNKGILCGPCNQGFSPLDALLKDQLQLINGLLGVRSDRHDEPQAAVVETVQGAIAIDQTGRPSFAAPAVLCERPHDEAGRKVVEVRFSSQKQVDEWYAAQRKLGLSPKMINRQEGTRYVIEPLPVEWSFGGAEAFREIGRIALNFVAHAWPDRARIPELQPFKKWVLGERVLADSDRKHVWYADDVASTMPAPPFEFGHQVLVVFDAERGAAYGTVRFFSTFELRVWFGEVHTQQTVCELYDIDPLAEHPPDDLRVSTPTLYPRIEPRVASHIENVNDVLRPRMAELFCRIQDRQWTLSTVGLLEALNGTRSLAPDQRLRKIAELLEPHHARVLTLAREVAADFRRRANADSSNVAVDLVATGFEQILAADRERPDGLSQQVRAALGLGTVGLVVAIGTELTTSDLTAERLRLYLDGGLGMHAVGTRLIEPLMKALEDFEAES